MTSPTLRFLPIAAATACFLGSTGSEAQVSQPVGIRVGDLELRPTAAAELGVDTNLLMRASDEDPLASLRLRISPALTLATLGAARTDAAPGKAPTPFTFRAGLSGIFNEYVGLSGTDADKALIDEQQRFSGALDVGLGFMQGQPLSALVNGSAARVVMPSNQGLAGNYNFYATRLGTEAAWVPGGKLLDWRFGYNFVANIYEQHDNLTSLNNEFVARGRWRFLPRTAALYDGRVGFITYPTVGSKTGSHPVRTRLGLAGLVTPSLSVIATAGWGASFYQPTGQANFDGVIGQAEARWFYGRKPTESQALATPGAVTELRASVPQSWAALGATRDFVDSFVGTYYATNRGYVSLSHSIGPRMQLTAELGAATIVYPDIALPEALRPRAGWTDYRIDGSVAYEQKLFGALTATATARYDANLSTTVLLLQSGAGGDHLAYNRVQTFAGLRWAN